MAKRPATCHPDRDHLAKGLCASCYVTARRQRERPNKTEEQKEAERAYFREYRRVWREENRERDRATQRKDHANAYKRDPVKHRQRAAAVRYGMTIPEYQAFIARAEGRCEACGTQTDRLQVDHCHETGRIRGAICGNCNSALGHAKDDIERLAKLIEYLNRTS